MAKGIRRRIYKATRKIEVDIKGFGDRGFYAAGLAGEGYKGGYRDALQDVLLLLNGIEPGNRGRFWWDEKI